MVIHVSGVLFTVLDIYHVQVEGDGKHGRGGGPYGLF